MDICCVCLNNDINLLEINQSTAKNDLSIKTLLELLVPEVIWLKHYLMCSNCLDDLKIILKFRQQCIQSQRIREMEIKAEETVIANEQSLDSDQFQDNSETKSSISFRMEEEEVPESNPETGPLLIVNQPLITSTETKFTCIQCGTAFNKKTELDEHEMTHPKKDEYNCETCGKCFESSLSLHFHNMAAHTYPDYTNEQPLTDPLHSDNPQKIQIQNAIPISLEEVVVVAATSEMPSNSYSYTVISNDPSGPTIETKFTCIHCGKEFGRKVELYVHEMIHLKKPEYKCGICGQCFDGSLSLRFHNMADHTNPMYWRYQCKSCHVRFSMKENLDEHMAVHHQKKPLKNLKKFGCDLCPRKFSVKRLLDTHKDREHEINNFKVEPEEI